MNYRVNLMWLAALLLFSVAAGTLNLRAGETDALDENIPDKPNPLEETGINNNDTATVETAGDTGKSDCCKWMRDHLKLSGEFKVRQESTWWKNWNNLGDRHRQRVRARLEILYFLDTEWLFATRLTTAAPSAVGTPDPTDHYHTLGSGSSSGMYDDDIYIVLDRLYVKYTPKEFAKRFGLEEMFIVAGKFPNDIFYSNPVFGNPIEDRDIQPEGVAVKCMRKIAGIDFGFYFGQFTVIENANAPDTSATKLQFLANQRFRNKYILRYSLKYKRYQAVSPSGAPSYITSENLFLATYNSENYTNMAGDPASDFGIIDALFVFQVPDDFNGFGFLPFTIPGPLFVSVEWLRNTGRASVADGEEEGYVLGFRFGKLKKPGDWEAWLFWKRLERDCVLAPLAPDRFPFRSNYRGVAFGGRYQYTERVWFQANIYNAKNLAGTPRKATWKAQVDAIVNL